MTTARLHLLPTRLLFILLGCTALAQSTPPPAITKERIETAHREAAAALEAQLGRELQSLPPILLAKASEVAKVIERENLPITSRRNPDDPEQAASEAREIGRIYSGVVMAKYSWSEKKVLVVKENWERTAAALPELRMTEDDVLRAMLVHELVHADDDQVHDLTRLLEEADTVESADALSALIEGHAQFITRQACSAAGWSEGFERFTRSIGAGPQDSSGEALRFLAETRAFNLRFAYIEGERFVAAVDEVLGAGGRAQAFGNVPRELELVTVPAWYIDPESRPQALYDPGPALDAFLADFDDSFWSHQRAELNSAQIAAGLNGLEPEDIRRIRGSFRAAEFVQLYPTANPNLKAVIGVVMEFEDSEAAAHFAEQSSRLQRMRDETMKEGVLRITAAKYTPASLENGSGLIVEKQMMNGSYEFSLLNVTAQRGRLSVELTFSGDPPSSEEASKQIDDLLVRPVLVK